MDTNTTNTNMNKSTSICKPMQILLIYFFLYPVYKKRNNPGLYSRLLKD